MRWHLGIAAVVLFGVGGWFAFGPRFAVTDAAYSRDKVVAGDAIIATFTSSWTEGYRYTRIEGAGWTWQRFSLSGEPLPDVVVNNGKVTAVRVAESCWIPLRHMQPPFVPGVTVATRLKNVPGVDREGTSFRYVTSPGESAVPSIHLRKEVEVEEELGQIEGRVFTARTSGADPAFMYGAYEIRAATPAEEADARALIAGMEPSPAALLEIRERILTSLIASVVTGPHEVSWPVTARITLLSCGRPLWGASGREHGSHRRTSNW